MPRQRLTYGHRRGQHGDLWWPEGSPPLGSAGSGTGWPVVVLLHGGFWKALYSLELMTALAADLMERGWAAWNLEYRRVGSIAGGGWPATFEDVALGIDHLAAMAPDHRLDLTRVVAVGHSAGGHLALWSAGRSRLPRHAPGAPGPDFVPLRAAVGLAAVADLEEAARQEVGRGAVIRLLGGSPDRHPDRYAVASPVTLLPLGVPQVLVHGDRDGVVPVSMSRRYVERATAAGDSATLVELADMGHMELIDPASSAWTATLVHLRRLLS